MLNIWTEKYRPAKLSDVIGENENINRLTGYVNEKNIPHLIFAGLYFSVHIFNISSY